MSKQMVHVSNKNHGGNEYCCVELQGLYSIDAEFFQIQELFESGEEPFDADAFHIFLFEPWWVSGFDACSCCFDDRGDLVFEKQLSDGS